MLVIPEKPGQSMHVHVVAIFVKCSNSNRACMSNCSKMVGPMTKLSYTMGVVPNRLVSIIHACKQAQQHV